MMIVLQLLLILVMMAGGSAVDSEEKKMDEKIREKIIEVVHKEHGWKTNEVRVDEVDRLRRGSCSFYTAGHTVRPLSYQLNYAVVSNDVVLSVSGNDSSLSRVLHDCGTDAPAGWWAEVITRFHPELGSGLVLHEAATNRGAVRKVQAAKQEFAPPAFGTERDHRSVTFFLLEPESFVVYSVKAEESKDGRIALTKTEIE